MDLSAVVVLFLNFLLCFGISGDPYETLGVSRNADEYEIKRAYKRLAKKWHPDRSKSRDAEAKFMAIADAYQVLSDPTKKDNYDRYGNEEPSQQGHHHYQQYSSGGDQYFYFQSANGQRFAFRGDPFQQQDPFGRRRHQAWQTRTPLSERIWAKLKTLPRAALVLFGLEEVPSWAAISLAIATVVGCAVLFRMMDVDRSKEAADAEARVNKAPTEIWLHEMTCQTYNGLLRLQKPGCRTILLLLDTETRESLAKEFGQAVYPYRNHKTLTFGVVNLDKYLHWYIQLLRKSDACYGKPLHLELKNVIGTVLVLNNFKRCISIFHAKTTVVKPKDDDEGCYGFSSSSESEKSDVEAGVVNRKQKRKGKKSADEPKSAEIPDPAVDSPRLQGLSLWLERLFDGQIPKIQVEEWPKLTP